MRVWSDAFRDDGRIPAVHATRRVAGGENVSFPLGWDGEPAEVASFALSVIDLHPVAKGWVHWLVVDIPAGMRSLPAGASRTPAMGRGTLELTGGYGSPGYGGPQPPPGTGDHVYQVTVHALDVSSLGLSGDAGLREFEKALDGHVLASAVTSGTFST